MDLGDGVYHNLHDHLKQIQSPLTKYTPETDDHLKDIYTTDVVSNTVENIYKENLYLQNRNIKDGFSVDLSNDSLRSVENFSLDNNYLSKSELAEVKQQTEEKFESDKDQMD